MRLKHLTIFFAILAAASLPRTAHAQDFDYDSYGVYDPYSNEISGYSITVDYMGYGVDLEADSDLLDPDEETVDSSFDDEMGEAEADVYCIPEQTGSYEIYGSHWYDGDGWNWLGDSYDDVDVPDIVSGVTTGSQTWYNGSQTWYSDSLDNPYSITINGLGFTDQPSLSGCSGGIDQSWWTVNYTQILGSLHVSTGLSTECTLVVMVGDFAAPSILLEPGAPPALSCPQTVTRGDTGTCTVSGVGAQLVSSWQFTGNGATVQGPSGSLSWSGTLVVSGTVSVTIAGIGTPLQATITVNPRSWHLAPANPADNEAIPLAHIPPQAYADTGLSIWTWGTAHFNWATIGSGPNDGFTYYTAPVTLDSLSYGYRINPDLVDQNSAFSQHQCGSNGYISWSDLYTQTRRHEYNSNTESHWAFYSNSMNSHNPGDYYEGQVANPGVDVGAFNAGTINSINALELQINTDGNAEPYGVNYSETGGFLGVPNFAPNYATCQ